MMLRALVLAAAAIAFTVALFGAAVDPGVWPAAIVAGAVLTGVAFERTRYGATRSPPAGGDWRETSERFIDDASGEPVTVWFDSISGERRYVRANSGRPV